MAYRIQKGNIRKPRRRRQTAVRRRSVRRAPMRRRTSSRRQTNRKNDCHCPGELSPSAKFALAQLDPFEPKCLGAKIPDTNTMPSLANADTDQVTLAGPATSGNLIAIAFKPSYRESINAATEGTGTVTWTNTWAQRRNYTNLSGSIEAIRPVSHAVRMVSPLAPTTATGFVHVGISVESRRSTQATAIPDLPRTVNDMTGLAHYKRFTLASLTQSPVTIINKWIDETAFRYDIVDVDQDFSAPATQLLDLTFNFNRSWAYIIVMVEGAPISTTALSFEHLLSTEMIPKRSAFILGNLAAPNSPGTISAVSTMQSETDFVHTEAEQDSYTSNALGELARGAQQAGEAVYNNVARPLLQRVGNAAGNAAFQMAANALMGRGGLPGVNSNPNRLITS